jgi:3-hydroxyisobutyrate dehydrogenase
MNDETTGTGTVAVLGTGTMGAPMARNLLRAGHEVRVWNRTIEKAEPLARDGATVAEDPADAVRGADVVVTMLSDADAVLDVAGGAADAFGDAVWAQMSTIGLEGTERCALLAEAHGISLVDAPVLGTRGPAEQGNLIVLASGPDAARERVTGVFDAVGSRTVWLGQAGAATRLKLVINAWIVTVTEGAAEVIALAEGLGVDPRAFLGAVEGGPLDNGYLRMKATMMLERDFPPSFSLRNAAKDADLVVAAGERHALDLPLPRAIAERLREGVETGHGEEDVAATYLTSALTISTGGSDGTR